MNASSILLTLSAIGLMWVFVDVLFPMDGLKEEEDGERIYGLKNYFFFCVLDKV